MPRCVGLRLSRGPLAAGSEPNLTPWVGFREPRPRACEMPAAWHTHDGDRHGDRAVPGDRVDQPSTG
jgi:hypothetical protein